MITNQTNVCALMNTTIVPSVMVSGDGYQKSKIGKSDWKTKEDKLHEYYLSRMTDGDFVALATGNLKNWCMQIAPEGISDMNIEFLYSAAISAGFSDKEARYACEYAFREGMYKHNLKEKRK